MSQNKIAGILSDHIPEFVADLFLPPDVQTYSTLFKTSSCVPTSPRINQPSSRNASNIVRIVAFRYRREVPVEVPMSSSTN